MIPFNYMPFSFRRELTAVAHNLADDPDLCDVVLTGRVKNFSLGMDLKDEKVAKSATTWLAERRVYNGGYTISKRGNTNFFD